MSLGEDLNLSCEEADEIDLISAFSLPLPLKRGSS